MARKAVCSVVALTVVLTWPTTASAQMPSWRDVQVADIVEMKDKWIALAGVFDSSHYDWPTRGWGAFGP
ncbi:MAG: hypothetical protein ACC682_17200 [Gemmatimonadota bacterium]